MQNLLRPALVTTLAFTLLTGIAYPLAMTGIGQLAFPAQANGSPVTVEGVVVGSALIGQSFSERGYFWPRHSATGPDPYNAAASSGSNYGPTDARLIGRVSETIAALGTAVPVPADAVTTSGSGLDPDISPANALTQVTRVAAARGLEAARIEGLVREMTQTPLMGIFGEPSVNVLALNLALDRLAPSAR